MYSERARPPINASEPRSEEHTSELQSPCNLVCRLLLEKKKIQSQIRTPHAPALLLTALLHLDHVRDRTSILSPLVTALLCLALCDVSRASTFRPTDSRS